MTSPWSLALCAFRGIGGAIFALVAFFVIAAGPLTDEVIVLIAGALLGLDGIVRQQREPTNTNAVVATAAFCAMIGSALGHLSVNAILLPA